MTDAPRTDRTYETYGTYATSLSHLSHLSYMSHASQRALCLVVFAALWFAAGCEEKGAGLTVSGRVEVDRVHIGSKIGGRILKVNYEEGDEVKGGAPVVELERTELEADLAQAQAQTSQTQAQLDLMLAGARAEDVRRAEAVVQANRAELDLRRKGFRVEEVGQAEAQLASAKTTLALAKKELDRAESLFKTGTIEQQQIDSRRAGYETARAAVDVADQHAKLMRSGSRPEEIAMAEAQLKQAEAGLERLRNGARPEEIAASRAALEAASANVARIQSQLDECDIRAPVDSSVETLELKPGDLLKAGQTVAVMNMKNRPYVRCYVPENRLGLVKPAMKVTAAVDTFPGQVFPGIVRHVNSEAEFTPRNVQTTEKRAELVFEMKVDITQNGDRLRAGMYADVHIP